MFTTLSNFIVDTEPPTCSFCPGDIAREETTREVRVNWKSPTCSDNSGIPPSIESNRQNGARFIVPGFYEIQYVVRDQAGNANKNCSLRITLKGNHLFPSMRLLYSETILCHLFKKNVHFLYLYFEIIINV